MQFAHPPPKGGCISELTLHPLHGESLHKQARCLEAWFVTTQIIYLRKKHVTCLVMQSSSKGWKSTWKRSAQGFVLFSLYSRTMTVTGYLLPVSRGLWSFSFDSSSTGWSQSLFNTFHLKVWHFPPPPKSSIHQDTLGDEMTDNMQNS